MKVTIFLPCPPLVTINYLNYMHSIALPDYTWMKISLGKVHVPGFMILHKPVLRPHVVDLVGRVQAIIRRHRRTYRHTPCILGTAYKDRIMASKLSFPPYEILKSVALRRKNNIIFTPRLNVFPYNFIQFKKSLYPAR